MEFEEAKKILLDRMDDHLYMVLATCAQDMPLACTMTCVVIDGDIYMQTDSTFPKCEQIRQNPHVALCSGSLNMEGVASFAGPPAEAAEGRFAQLFSRYYPDSYQLYAGVSTEVVIRVQITHAVDWLYEKGASEMLEIDFLKQEAHFAHYENALTK